MIHLDTNILIDLSSQHSDILPHLITLENRGFRFSCSAITWFEFCNGPCTEAQQQISLKFLNNIIIPFSQHHANLASQLFNQTGRRRSSRADCMIAAVAILNNAPIATYNVKDFEKFTPNGLKIEAISPNPPIG